MLSAVLRQRMVLPDPHSSALPPPGQPHLDTPSPHGISLRAPYAMSGTGISHDMRFSVRAYARVMRCPLCAIMHSAISYALAGTDFAYLLPAAAKIMMKKKGPWGFGFRSKAGTSLRASYAMSGTDLPYGGCLLCNGWYRPSV
eukprot:3941989-Rhodomonas_salina.3